MNIDENCCFPLPSGPHSKSSISAVILREQSELIFKRCIERSSRRGTLYCGGLGPHVFMRIQLAKADSENKKHLLQEAKATAEYVLGHSPEDSRITLLESRRIGTLCLLSVVEKNLSDNDSNEDCPRDEGRWMAYATQVINELSRKCETLAAEECEVLYGRAGALAAIFYLRQELDSLELGRDFVVGTAVDILREGLKKSKSLVVCLPLVWQWHGKNYLGAAHGTVGILHMLLQLRDTEFDQVEARVPGARTKVKKTIEALASLCHPSGNLMSSLSDQPSASRKDRLVQWCHGAPGHCLLLIKAYEVFREDHYLKAASEIAEKVIWPRGLLTKGVGLCHGISGNGCVMLRLSEASASLAALWRPRVIQYAKFALDALNNLEDVADRPFSLFEGSTGLAAFLLDLSMTLHHESESPSRIRFPLYDFG